jgi:branched-chain amino acid transport system substrate-binding protein
MKGSSWIRIVAVVGVLGIVAAACSNDETPPAGGTTSAPVEKVDVTVFIQGAWTGGVNSLTLPSFQGGQIRFDELNADASYPATITVEQADTQGSSTEAPQVAQEAVQDPNTVAIFGPAFSGESKAVGDTYNEAGIPFITASATSVELASFGWENWYRAVGNDDAQGRLAARWVAEVLKPKKLYIVHDNTTYGKPLAETVEKAARDAGLNVVGKSGVAEPAIESGTTVNFSSIITTIKQSGADSVFFGGYFVDSGPFLNQAAAAGLKLTLISGDGSVSSDFVNLAGADAAEGSLLLAPSNINADFVDKYNQEIGGEALSIPVYAGEGYDVASLIGEGIKSAIEGGATTPEEIRPGIKAYLDGLTPGNEFEGVTKAYSFDPTTHELATAADDLYYFYQVKNGAVENLGNATEVLGG